MIPFTHLSFAHPNNWLHLIKIQHSLHFVSPVANLPFSLGTPAFLLAKRVIEGPKKLENKINQ